MSASATGLAALERFESEGFELDPVGDSVAMRGTLAMRDPAQTVLPALQRLHRAVIEGGLREVQLDVRQLRFVNSSAMRVFFNWLRWIQQEPADRRYKISVISDPTVSWQRLSLPTLRGRAPEVLELL